MKKIVIITANELRHNFFRIYLGSSGEIQILKAFCESGVPLNDKIKEESKSENRSWHLLQRAQTEIDFFHAFVHRTPDNSNPIIIQKEAINDDDYVNEIIQLNPDFIISYGCSIIKSNLLQHFKHRFINIHLGLSPYYRGSGTNFWPFVNCEPGLIGVTFMYIDEGIDTGQIIHQIRAEIYPWDTMHSIGNRLITNAAQTCEKLLVNFDQLKPIPRDFFPTSSEKYYKNKDFNELAVLQANQNITQGILNAYLLNKNSFDNKHPIFENPGIILQYP